MTGSTSWTRGWYSATGTAAVLLVTALGIGWETRFAESAADAGLGALALELRADLRAGTPLAAWRAANPDDRVSPRTAASRDGRLRVAEGPSPWGFHSAWCARAEKEIPLEQGTAIRTVYFYLPEMPDPPALPPPEGSDRLVDECRLGFAWIEAVHPDSAAAEARRAGTLRMLSDAMGSPAPGARLSWWGSGSWWGHARWEAEDLLLGAAAGTIRLEPDSTRVFVLAAGPAARIDFGGWRFAEPFLSPREERRLRDAERMGEALEILGPRARDVRTYLAPMGGGPPRDRALTEEEASGLIDLVERLAADGDAWNTGATGSRCRR